jgi:hypothetical protein
MDCRDVLDAVYVHTKDTYIAKFYTREVKSKTLSENQDINENLKKTVVEDPRAETNTNFQESNTDVSETVKSSVERTPESEIKLEIRKVVQEKFPYALASVCSDLATLDKMYRAFKNHGEQHEFCEYILDVGDEFPLSDRFVFPCVMFVCSVILADLDEKRSDYFYKRYVKATEAIVSEIPMEAHPIKEKYSY